MRGESGLCDEEFCFKFDETDMAILPLQELQSGDAFSATPCDKSRTVLMPQCENDDCSRQG